MADLLEERLGLMAARMTMREAFIGSMFSTLPRTVTEAGDHISTAATNGQWFKFNREFCDPLPNEELFGLCMHEALHVTFMHMWRRDGREPSTWNVANDAIINRIIQDSGYKLPAGGVDIPWVTQSMSSEEVYTRLYKEMEDGGTGDSPDGEEGEEGKGGMSHPVHGKGGFDGTGDLEDAPEGVGKLDMEAQIKAMAKMAKACGDNNCVLDRILGDELKATVNWLDVVRNMLNSASRNEFSYARVNRRFIANGIYMPALYSQSMGMLGIGYDTSGSMGQRECDAAAGEIHGIINDCEPDSVEVVYCDTKISSTQTFDKGEQFVLKPTGGGGTKFKPVFDYFIAKSEPLAGMVYFTDLEGNLDECPDPQCPVIWAYTGTGDADSIKVPFGIVVKVQLGSM